MAAALVEMVCNLTVGKPAYAEHEPAMIAARERAHALRAEGVTLVGEDAAAFRSVIEAYKLPREGEAAAALRSERIQSAFALAAGVPVETANAAGELLGIAESIVAGANPNVVSDLAAAAACARAALSTALVNIEINRESITDQELRASLATHMGEIEQELAHAETVVASVRKRLVG